MTLAQAGQRACVGDDPPRTKQQIANRQAWACAGQRQTHKHTLHSTTICDRAGGVQTRVCSLLNAATQRTHARTHTQQTSLAHHLVHDRAKVWLRTTHDSNDCAWHKLKRQQPERHLKPSYVCGQWKHTWQKGGANVNSMIKFTVNTHKYPACPNQH